MADGPLDFAVLGSTPLALLLAGLLASVHKKSVVLVSESHSSYRLTRGFDLSIGPITRPETWALLNRTVPEVRKLLASIGAKGAVERIDPLLVAETAAGSEVLSHLRYLLLAHGAPVERLSADGAGVTYRIRDALRLRRMQLSDPASKWLARSGVRVLPSEGTTATFSTDGVTLARGEETVAAAQAVAADDTAVLAALAAEEREPVLRTETVTTLLTEPLKSLPAPLTLVVDRGVMLHQVRGGGVEVLAGGGADAVSRAGMRLGDIGKLRRAGQTGFSVLVPPDGAPVVGRAKSLPAILLGGFGPIAAFLAPAVARHLAGAGSADEQAYFAARGTVMDSARSGAVEFAGVSVLGSAS